MTSEDVKSELDRDPFIPFRLHLVSGKTVLVPGPGMAYMMQNAVLVFHDRPRLDNDPRYDVLALRNIERLEQIEGEAASESAEDKG